MAKRLTDRQRKKLVADYMLMGNYSAVARKHKVSADTVKNAVKSDPDFARKSEQKKEETETDILAYMDEQSNMVKNILGKGLQSLDQKIGAASPKEIATIMGILIDKWTKERPTTLQNEVEDDPLTKALKEEAERMEKGAD